RAPNPAGGYSFAASVVNGILYRLGGYDNLTSTIVPTVEAYDPLNNTWFTEPPMLTGRYGLAAEVINGAIYTVGGFSNGSLATVEAFLPVTPP
ncbi:MAG TPA: kelch repeat-containing protein, partial [Nitrospiria bacterium]|nr:kelch repeat-containing protein [Nitrospiria bacterium]